MGDLAVVVLLLVLALAPFVVVSAVLRRREAVRGARSSTVALTVDEFGVRRELADGRREEVDWGEISEVDVYRTDRGPHGVAGGMVMLSGDATRGCLVPLDHLESSGLVEALQQLPGFRLDSFTEALTAEPPSQLTVWRRGS